MYEVEKKFSIHSQNVLPFLARLTAIGFEQVSQKEQKVTYLTTGKDRVIKLIISRSQIGDSQKIKTEYALCRRQMHTYEVEGQKDKKELPMVEQEDISRFVTNTMLNASGKEYLLTMSRLRRTFKKKPPATPGIQSDNTHFLTVDFDEVQGLGSGNNLYIEFKVNIEKTEYKKDAVKAINAILDELKPFVGDFSAHSYLQMLKHYSKNV